MTITNSQAPDFAVNFANAAGIATGLVTAPNVAAGTANVPNVAAGSVNAPNFASGLINAPNVVTSFANAPNVATGSINAHHVATGSANTPGFVTSFANTAGVATGSINPPNVATGLANAPSVATGSINDPDVAASSENSPNVATGSANGPDVGIESCPHPLPPLDVAYNTPQEALDAVNNAIKSAGYAVTVSRTGKTRGGMPRYMGLHCDRGGKYVPHVTAENRKRNTSTKRLNCPFKLTVRCNQDTQTWHMTVECAQHNHPPSPPSTHSSQRRKELETMKPFIISQMELQVPTRHILTGLRAINPSCCIRARDINNQRLKFNWERECQNLRSQGQSVEPPASGGNSANSGSSGRVSKTAPRQKRKTRLERAQATADIDENIVSA